MAAVQETVDRVRRIDVDQYRYGFETLMEADRAPKGMSEDTVGFISEKKNEPAWVLEWRLEAYRRWLTMTEPTWARVNYPKIDYQDLYYYSAPKPKKTVSSLDEIDPEILKTYEKLGIPLREVEVLEGVVRPEGQRKIAVDAVFDSVSVATTFQKELKAAGVIFMPISEAIREHPELVQKYLGEIDPEILKTYEKLGIPLREVEVLEGVVRPEGQRKIAVDAVFDSVSVATTFQKELKAAGVIFMPISEAIREHPELVQKYLG